MCPGIRIGKTSIGLGSSSSSWSSYWTTRITNVVVTPITGGNRITWTSVAGHQTEIWASIDGGTYTLLTTQNIGVETYDHTGLYAQIVDYRLRTYINVFVAPSIDSALITGGVRLTVTINNTDATHVRYYANIAGAGYNLIATVAISGVTSTYDHSPANSTEVTIVYKATVIETEFVSPDSNETSEVVPSAGDADALALFARMLALGEEPDSARKTILNDAFVLGNTKAFWVKMNGIWLLASHGTLSSRLNILADTFNITIVSTPTFETDRGWTGSGGKYLNFNFNFSTNGGTKYTLDSASVGKYSRTNITNANPVLGTTAATNNTHEIYSGHLYWRINSTAYADIATPGTVATLVTCTRTSSTNVNVYRGNTKTSHTANSSSIPNTNLVACNDSPNQLSFIFVGAALDDQDVADIITVFVDGYLQSIGAKV